MFVSSAITRAPIALPSCTAEMPTPPAAPSTSRRCPGVKRSTSVVFQDSAIERVNAVWLAEVTVTSTSSSPQGFVTFSTWYEPVRRKFKGSVIDKDVLRVAAEAGSLCFAPLADGGS